MSTELLVTIVYFLIFLGGLSVTAVPFMFFFLWTFFAFWKKHIVWFYILCITLWAAIIAAFYFTEHLWVYWYYAFPQWVQIVGLILVVFSSIVLKLAEATITVQVRFFYPLLKEKPIRLKTTGIYKHLRHPMYAIFPLIVLGALFYTGQLILIPVFFLVLITRTWCADQEESHLKKVVKGDYKKYMKQTPNRFYPKLF